MALIRETTAIDAEQITAFLQPHIETSMFLLSNLEQHGIGTSDHPHATRYFLYEAGTKIHGVFGVTQNGYLMCQHPRLCLATARGYLARIEGTTVQGMTGDSDQVSQFIDALPDLHETWLLNRVEPLFTLDLATLQAPLSRLSLPKQNDSTMLEDWFEQLLIETGIASGENARHLATLRTREAIAGTGTRIYCGEDRAPIGMTSVNARAGDCVQIGGVFVRPDCRGQGHAGRMVAAQLAELRDSGTQTALLFAASDAAAKAYTRIGFRRLGDYRVAMLNEACTLGATA